MNRQVGVTAVKGLMLSGLRKAGVDRPDLPDAKSALNAV